MRYWTLGLLGVAICSAASVVVAWCTYAATRISLCTATGAGDALDCRFDGEQLAAAIGVALLFAIPLGSSLFTARVAPRGSPLGALALGLGLTAAGGAALLSATGSAAGTPAQAPGIAVGATLLSIGPIVLLIGLAASLRGRGGDPQAAARALAEAQLAAASAGTGGAHAGVSVGGDDTGRGGAGGVDLAGSAFGTLATQLTQMAAAQQRTGGDAVAAKLRQLDDLRASGLLSAEEHARKRREILDSI